MPTNRESPIAIEVVEDLSARLEDQIEDLVKSIERADDARSGWLKKQLQYIKARYGKRRKKTVPWANASNISVPLVDGIIRRWRPGIVSLVLDANPVAYFSAQEPTDFDPAREVEPFFTWLFVDHMRTAKTIPRLADLIAVRGHAYAREGWEYVTERSARVALVEHIFPEGVQEYLDRAMAQQALASDAGNTGEELDPADLISLRLVQQYRLNADDPEVSQMLTEASMLILQGAQRVKITYEKVAEDRPDWQPIDPVWTIPDMTPNPEEGEFFVIIHQMSEQEIRRRGRDGQFVPQRAAELVEKIQDSRTDSTTAVNKSGGAGGAAARQQIMDFMQRRSGNITVDTHKPTVLRTNVWEAFALLDVNGDGIKERCRFWYAPKERVVLSVSEYVFPFREWPVTLYKYEPHAEYPVDSRGIPELLSDLQKLTDAFHNARIDASQILLAPVFQRASSATDYAQQIQWRPGAIIPVQRPGDIQPIPHDLRILTGLLTEEQYTQRLAEGYIGTFDATLNQLSQPTERRTAAEVQAIQQLAQNVFGLDARAFQNSMAESFQKIWKLWQEFGPDEIYFRVRGSQKPQLSIKAEIDYDYDIAPAGTPSSTNKSFLMAAMTQILQIIMNDASGRFDVGALLEKYFKLIDVNLAADVVRPPEEATAAKQVIDANEQLTGERIPF